MRPVFIDVEVQRNIDGDTPSVSVPSDNAACLAHYDNTPMQFTAIFHGCKSDNF